MKKLIGMLVVVLQLGSCAVNNDGNTVLPTTCPSRHGQYYSHQFKPQDGDCRFEWEYMDDDTGCKDRRVLNENGCVEEVQLTCDQGFGRVQITKFSLAYTWDNQQVYPSYGTSEILDQTGVVCKGVFSVTSEKL